MRNTAIKKIQQLHNEKLLNQNGKNLKALWIQNKNSREQISTIHHIVSNTAKRSVTEPRLNIQLKKLQAIRERFRMDTFNE